MSKVRIKRGDKVQVIAGKDAGKQGNVLAVDKDKNRVIVEGINMITKHQKPRGADRGGIINREAAIHASNVMYVHNGKPTRLGIKITTETKNGQSVSVKKRFSKTTGDVID